MKNPIRLSATLKTVVLIVAFNSHGQAQTTITNDLTVLGFVDATNDISYGTTATNQTNAVHLSYTDSNYTVGILSTQPSSAYLWQDNGIGVLKNKLLLDGSNNLSLYGTNGSKGITFNPNTGGITLAGTGSGIILADGTVLSGASSLQPTGLYDSYGDQMLSFDGSDDLSAQYSSASGGGAAAFGNGTSASGDYSDSFGQWTAANNHTAFAAGDSCVASGWGAVALGSRASALGGASFAVGDWPTASGGETAALGSLTIANAYSSVAIGQNNVGVVSSGGDTQWNSNDPVLEIGNGEWDPYNDPWNPGAPSDAVIIFKTGEVRTEGLIQSQTGMRTPPTGNLSMGSYTNGANPATLSPQTGLLYPSGN